MFARHCQVRCALLLALLAAVSTRNALGQVQYSVIDIGAILSGGVSEAYGINNAGQVVGCSAASGVYGHAFLYSSSSGSMQDVGTLGGGASSAAGINNLGQVVGQALTSSGVAHAFIYSGSSMQDLGTFPGGGLSRAAAVNNLGQVVGYSNTTVGGASNAFLYSGGSMQNLGTLPVALQRQERSQRHQR